MKTKSDQLDSIALAVARAAPDLRKSEHIALSTYRRLAEGSPVAASEIAELAGTSVEEVQGLLRSWPGVFLDHDQRVVGFWGLTIQKLAPTHRLEMDGRELFAWCAWDTLFLPGILATSLSVESACPITDETISLVVSPEGVVETSHPDALVSFLLPDHGFDADVVESFCHFVYFFASATSGEAWTAEHPGTFLLTLREAFDLGRMVNALNFPSVLGGGR